MTNRAFFLVELQYTSDIENPAEFMDKHPHISLPQALMIVVICFGYFILGSVSAISSGALESGGDGAVFSDNMFISIMMLEVVLACTALAVLRASKFPLASLLPRPSWNGVGVGLLLYAATCVACLVVDALAGARAAEPVESMVEQAHVSLLVLLPLALINGTFEEVFLLAYLQRGLRRFGGSNAVGISVLVRLLYHLYQGPVGATKMLMVGLVFSLYYFRTGRLFPVVASHVVADVVPFLGVL